MHSGEHVLDAMDSRIERKRRVLLLLDRALSSALGRSCGMQDEE